MGDYTFGGKYRLEEEIAIGGCGSVFMGVHTVAGKEVAIKVEPAHPSHLVSPLRQESKIYKTLMGGTGVPWLMYSGKQGDYNVLVMDLLGPSLEDVFKMCNKRFELRTVLMLGVQLTSRLEYIHSRGLVHRDVKPANFVMSALSQSSTPSVVNVIDFGLAKRYRDPLTGVHIPYRQDDHHGVGTSLFASINTHLGAESARRDDLESLVYMLIYFLRGSLPWRRIRSPNGSVSETWDLIRDAKLTHDGQLFVGVPREIRELYAYARGMAFEEEVDWEGVRGLLQACANRNNVDIESEGLWEWEIGRIVKPESGRRRNCAACQARRERSL